MAYVKVWNDNKLDHVEMYKGDKLTIPAGKFIVMNSDEATQFMGQYFTVKRDADGQALPSSFKMLRKEPHLVEGEAAKAPEVLTPDPLKCIACAYKASSAADAKEHLATHADSLVVDEEAEKEIKARAATKKRAG